MERSEAVGHIAEGLRTVLNKEIPNLTTEMRLIEDVGLDSTTVIELLMALEDKVPGMVVEPDELEADVFENVGTLADYMVTSTTQVGAGSTPRP